MGVAQAKPACKHTIATRKCYQYNTILADLDITQSGKAAPTLKHEHRVVICHLKLIDVMYSFIIYSFTVYSGLAVIDMLFLILL